MKLALPLLLLAIVTTTARADMYVEPPVDFSLRFSHHELTLDYGTSRVATQVNRVGIDWRERYGERLVLGLTGGYSFLTQTDNPPTAGRELRGYHAGVLMDVDLIARPRYGASLEAAWLYQNVDTDDGAQRVDIAWREPSVRLRAGAAVGDGVRAYAGVRYGAIDGQQRLSGTINETRTIQETDRSGGFAGLELTLEGNGYVGISAASGPDRQVDIYFGRQF